MNVVILNWGSGENDPFTYFSACLKQVFERMGRSAHVVTFSDRTLADLSAACTKGVDFVITWQGIGLQMGAQTPDAPTLWDMLKVPLICYHGDHPAHAPGNHKAMSSWVRHVYASPGFSTFANRWIPRKRPATFFHTPVFFPDAVQGRFEGDYFVLPKNLDPLDAMLDTFRRAPQRRTGAFMLEAADAIMSEFRNGNTRNHHDLVEAMLTDDVLASLCNELDNTPLTVRLHLHALLDKVHRNAVSEHILNELKEVPLKIYGRGWDRFRAQGNRQHEYLHFDAMSDNAFQFSSNYGILDVAPIHDTLHDRTYRAMANKAGFLMGANWQYETFLGGDYGALFFDGKRGALRERAERVMSAPDAHRAQVREFTRDYQRHFSYFNFVKYLEGLSDSVRAQNRV
jgi:hypothetical protein